MQPEFSMPEFIENSSAEEIHRRMMNNLPEDIDNMPAGFPYDFTMPAAIEKSEFINYHLVRAVMTAFPQYAWDDWLDLHGKQVHLSRHEPVKAAGNLIVSGSAGTKIEKGTIFCTPATKTGPAIGFSTDQDYEIGEEGTATIEVTAVEAGTASNIKANTVTIMERPIKGITTVNNPEAIIGGTDRESDSDFYDRIASEYESNKTFIGNDSDYIRWAKEAGAGGCIVVTDNENPGVVQLVLTDRNGQPANGDLINKVEEHILSPEDRSKRLLPTACAKLVCKAPESAPIRFICRGLLYNEALTDIEQIKKEFSELVKDIYETAKKEKLLRYNDVRPLLNRINGVEDFDQFLVNDGMVNVVLEQGEYPITDTLDFS
ncbi:MAG: hypothetical protein HFI75_03660 [Lachnospiraceae bacterium]|nr:hypothetical protein [Lachnospiraceae bacterium]